MEIASHYRHLLRELDQQRQHGVLCDVCVVVEGKVFKAHKNVLLGSSRYFKTLYCQVQKTSEPATVTHLDIVTAQGFKAIIDFMYSAHLALTSRNVIEVMSAASFLQMTDIVQACHDFIKAALDISIKPDASDELADFEMGAPPGSGADALISAVMAGRSISPWLARRASPTNSSGDSAIASCHEGGSSYSKEDPEPKADGPDDLSAQVLWPGDVGYGPLRIKEEQISPPHYGGGEPPPARDGAPQNSFPEQAGADGWQPTGRRKNRKNKETVRHITQQVEDESQAGSPVPSFLPTSGWPFNIRDSSKPVLCSGRGSDAEWGPVGARGVAQSDTFPGHTGGFPWWFFSHGPWAPHAVRGPRLCCVPGSHPLSDTLHHLILCIHLGGVNSKVDVHSLTVTLSGGDDVVTPSLSRGPTGSLGPLGLGVGLRDHPALVWVRTEASQGVVCVGNPAQREGRWSASEWTEVGRRQQTVGR